MDRMVKILPMAVMMNEDSTAGPQVTPDLMMVIRGGMEVGMVVEAVGTPIEATIHMGETTRTEGITLTETIHTVATAE